MATPLAPLAPPPPPPPLSDIGGERIDPFALPPAEAPAEVPVAQPIVSYDPSQAALALATTPYVTGYAKKGYIKRMVMGRPVTIGIVISMLIVLIIIIVVSLVILSVSYNDIADENKSNFHCGVPRTAMKGHYYHDPVIFSGRRARCANSYKDWDPAAIAEAQALAQVGAYQHDDYGEPKLQGAIRQAFDVKSAPPYSRTHMAYG